MFLSRSPLTARKRSVRLACIRHAASVDPEPGSNSSNNGEAGLAAGVHPRRGPCGGNARRMLHTSVGKVPGDKKASRPREPCSTRVSPWWCLRITTRDRCRCRQRQVYQAHSSVSSEPGRSCISGCHVCACARDGVANDERKCTSPNPRCQGNTAPVFTAIHSEVIPQQSTLG